MLTNELMQLHALRVEVDIKKIVIEQAKAAFEQTQEYQTYVALKESLNGVLQEVTDLEEHIRQEAVELSRQTGFAERKFGAITIKEFTKLIILDDKAAVQWAAANAPSCLTLTKSFEKAAKALELPFVKIEKEFKAQIASDLSKILDEKENSNG